MKHCVCKGRVACPLKKHHYCWSYIYVGTRRFEFQQKTYVFPLFGRGSRRLAEMERDVVCGCLAVCPRGPNIKCWQNTAVVTSRGTLLNLCSDLLISRLIGAGGSGLRNMARCWSEMVLVWISIVALKRICLGIDHLNNLSVYIFHQTVANHYSTWKLPTMIHQNTPRFHQTLQNIKLSIYKMQTVGNSSPLNSH